MVEKDYKIILGDCLETLKSLPDESVQCCITSPPYYGLRDYGTGTWVGGDPNCPHYRTSKYSENTCTVHKAMAEQGEPVGDAIYKTVCPICGAVREDKQIGLEETPEQYVEKLVEVFREVRRVLKDDGTLWLNLGDSYAGSGKGAAEYPENAKKYKQGTNRGMVGATATTKIPKQYEGIKPKDLVGIPWMVAFALRADGWWLRQDIIWHKLNPMPESVRDRCTKSHEYIFLLSKSNKYYFDYMAIQEATTTFDTVIRDRETTKLNNTPGRSHMGGLTHNDYEFRNKRDVWSMTTNPFHGAHFATYPEELVIPCVLAGTDEGDTVLDPFNGAATTGVVALKHGRKYIGCELNQEYIDISENRIKQEVFGQQIASETAFEGKDNFERFDLGE